MNYASIIVAIGLGWLVPHALWRFLQIVRRSKMLHGLLSAVLVPAATLTMTFGFHFFGYISVERMQLWPMAMQSSMYAIGVIIFVIAGLHRERGQS